MKIAIVGAGFLGLACAWHLSQRTNTQITLFDQDAIGAGASGMAAGLLHPFGGAKARLSWNAEIAFPEALSLLDVASKESMIPLVRKTGIFRPALRPDQVNYFKQTALQFPDCIWQEEPAGLFLPMGVQVDCPNYLQALWKACERRGCRFTKARILSPNELPDFDFIVFTVGAKLHQINDVETPKFEAVKGQLLELAYPDLIPHAIIGKAYIAQMNPGTLIAGSTYEHSWTTELPDLATCEAAIRKDVAVFSQEFAALTLISCKAGFRASTPDKRPFLVKSSARSYSIGGLGSKGLLYHAYLARTLSELL